MADVEFANGSKRYPVEDLEIATPSNTDAEAPKVENNSIPGGRETVSNKSARRIAAAYIKKSLYWAARDRQYRSNRTERASNSYNCPKHPEVTLKPAIYKRREGVSDRLMGCPECMFMIKVDDILGDSIG
jgi:hypothetical protein